MELFTDIYFCINCIAPDQTVIDYFLYTHSVSEEMHCEKELGEDLHEASDPYTHWICWKTVKDFQSGVDDYYSFKPQQILEAHLEVHPFQNGKE